MSKQRAIHGLITTEAEEMALNENFYGFRELSQQEELTATFVNSFRTEIGIISQHLAQSDPINYLSSLEEL